MVAESPNNGFPNVSYFPGGTSRKLDDISRRETVNISMPTVANYRPKLIWFDHVILQKFEPT